MSTKKKKQVATKNRQTEEQPIPCNTITPDFTQHTPVGEIGIEVVAGIAAHFPIEMDPPDAIRRAYLLLEYASAGRRGEVSLGGYEAGIKQLLEAQGDISEMVEWQGSLPRDLFQGLPGDIVTVPLDDVLANLMPPYEMKDRLPYFEEWLIYWGIVREDELEEDHRHHDPTAIEGIVGAIAKGEASEDDFNPEARRNIAEGLISQWRKEGVPERIYLKARYSIKNFLMVKKRLKHVADGTAGAEAKKRGKQGRVTKKTDKRTGSRLPGEKSPRAKKTR